MEEELLVNTRKRRANAGSRLKQLLSAEETAAGEEDDVDLLFVEDEDDQEYNSESEDEDLGSDEEGDVNDKGTKKLSETLGVESGREEESGEENQDETATDEEPINDDEMFSDSSDEDSSGESDVGEKELQKAERARLRELKKKKRAVPQIKKPSNVVRKPKKIYEAPKADTLLSENRRQSSRRAAVQNKLDLVEKLKEEEQRRSTLKPVQKIEYVELTQEERLAEAIETEKYNISTLNKYQEQEVDKAKRRREMMMNKRRKLTDVMTITTKVKFVEIEEERELEKFYLTRDILKKKDRRGRKSEKQRREEEQERLREQELRERWEQLNNPEIGYVVGTKPDKMDQTSNAGDASTVNAEPSVELSAESSAEPSARPSGEPPVEPSPDPSLEPSLELSVEPSSDHSLQPSVKAEIQSSVVHSTVKAEVSASISQAETSDVEMAGTEEPTMRDSTEEHVTEKGASFVESNTINSDNGESIVIDVQKEAEGFDVVGDDLTAKVVKAEEKEETVPPEDNEGDVQMRDASNSVITSPTDATPAAKGTPEIKTVKFADQLKQKAERPKVIYEGPKQKVGVNLVSFENGYTINRLRSLMFGHQSLLPAQRKAIEVEPLVRLRQDPLDSTFDPASTLKLPDLSVLDSFPEFGNFEKVHREIRTVEAVQATKIVLKTEAPTGIYLPSGQRKTCLITGKPAMYFDPSTGMPYADVEGYKIIKEIQEGKYEWVEGGYVAKYHAKGVPAGFDD